MIGCLPRARWRVLGLSATLRSLFTIELHACAFANRPASFAACISRCLQLIFFSLCSLVSTTPIETCISGRPFLHLWSLSSAEYLHFYLAWLATCNGRSWQRGWRKGILRLRLSMFKGRRLAACHVMGLHPLQVFLCFLFAVSFVEGLKVERYPLNMTWGLD